MVNTDVPAGVGAPPLNTQLPLLYVCDKDYNHRLWVIVLTLLACTYNCFVYYWETGYVKQCSTVLIYICTSITVQVQSVHVLVEVTGTVCSNSTSSPDTMLQRVWDYTPRRRGGWSLRIRESSWWSNTFRMWYARQVWYLLSGLCLRPEDGGMITSHMILDHPSLLQYNSNITNLIECMLS